MKREDLELGLANLLAYTVARLPEDLADEMYDHLSAGRREVEVDTRGYVTVYAGGQFLMRSHTFDLLSAAKWDVTLIGDEATVTPSADREVLA